MDVTCHRYVRNGSFCTSFRVYLTPEEQRVVRDAKLGSCKIHTRGGPPIGSSPASNALFKSFAMQLNRVRGRWNVAVQRTTGYVLLDTLCWVGKGAKEAIKLPMRLVAGTRSRFADLTEGAEFESDTVEEAREVETMVLASLSAIESAIRFAADHPKASHWTDGAFRAEVPGLTFAGGIAHLSQEGNTSDADEEGDDDDQDEEHDEAAFDEEVEAA